MNRLSIALKTVAAVALAGIAFGASAAPVGHHGAHRHHHHHHHVVYRGHGHPVANHQVALRGR